MKWNFNTILEKFPVRFLLLFHTQHNETDSTRHDLTWLHEGKKVQQLKVLLCLPSHIWHVNKLNFKYFLFCFLLLTNANSHKIINNFLPLCDCEFSWITCEKISLASRLKNDEEEEKNCKTKTKLLMNFHTTVRVLWMMLSIDRVNED